MSAQLKSFEGPDVQVLLDRIRVELGPSAKIDGAVKVRVGGLLGFFAKEHYRVVVEVPDPTDISRSPASDLAAAPATTDLRSPRRAPRPGPAAPSQPLTAVTTDVFSAMADATDDVNDIGTRSVRAPVVAAGGSVPPAPEAPGPTSDARTEPEAPAESFDAVLTRVATTLETTPAQATANGSDSPTGPGITANQNTFSGTGPPAGNDTDPAPEPKRDGTHDVADAPVDIASKAALFLAGTVAPAAPSGPVTPGRTSAEPDGPLAGALRRVGLDTAAVASVTEGLRRGSGLESLLLDAFGGLPPAPALPRQVGSLLVVVGAGVQARRLAASVAGEIGIDPADVPFASLDAGAYAVATGALLVRCAEDASDRAPGWRRSRAVVVVVDAAMNSSEAPWARHLIASLRPTAVWAIVDSTSKTEDIAAWIETLGGIDALALENTDATVSPAAALALGIPVARLNGQPATAARWVATITDRISPCT